MSDPWKVLELDPATATVRDLKRAYARLIKQHRPEEDPEAFQQIHEAYQIALGRLDFQVGPQAPLPKQEPRTNPPQPFEAIQEGPDLRVEATLSHLEAGRLEGPLRALGSFIFEDPQGWKRSVADGMLEQPLRFQRVEAATFACHLARLLVFGTDATSDRLLDMAYKILPPTHREQMIDSVAIFQQFAPGFHHLEPAHQEFWAGAVCAPADVDWDSPQAVSSLEVLKYQNLMWNGFELLEQIVPAEQHVWRTRRREGFTWEPEGGRKAWKKEKRRRRRSRKFQTAKQIALGVFILIVIPALINLLFLLLSGS